MKTLNLVLVAAALTAGFASTAFASDVDRVQQEETLAIAQGHYQATPVVTEGRQAAANASVSANDQLFVQISLERNASRH
jgi:hypothetical protein